MRYLKHDPKRVALVCMGPSATDYLQQTLTQEYNPHWVDEVWAINMAANPFRCDVVFWMDDLIEQEKFRPNLFVALRKFGVKVISSVARPNIVPDSYDYPIQEISQISIPILGKPYLNNGVAMAIAYALWKGVKYMVIYGADFSYPNRDYAESGRGCVEVWIAIASQAGMEIQLSPNTSLLDTVKDHGIYGYAEQPAITLPSGKVFKYVKQANAKAGKYIPEDSSGVKPNGAVQIPDSGARSPTSDNGRASKPDSDSVAQSSVTPALGSSKGVRGRPPKKRDDKKQGLALHDSSRGAGGLPAGAGEPVPPPARPDYPRR